MELVKTSRKTITMLQERLKQMDALTETEEEPSVPGLVLGNEWKLARKKHVHLKDQDGENNQTISVKNAQRAIADQLKKQFADAVSDRAGKVENT